MAGGGFPGLRGFLGVGLNQMPPDHSTISRTRIMNQLQAVALNEGLRCKKKLWREAGREQLESFRLAARGASLDS